VQGGEQDRDAPESPREVWRPRFGIGTLLLIMLVCCTLAASLSYLFQAVREGHDSSPIFVIMTAAAPTLLIVVLSFLGALFALGRRNRR